MGFLRSPLGAITIVVFVALALFVGAMAFKVEALTSPDRSGAGAEFEIDLQALLPEVRPVRFAAVDGVSLDAWLLPGIPGQPAVILCHDRGASKTALAHLAAGLGELGMTVLLFDFRGHGGSGGRRSTLGLDEKRDVLAAVDYLADGEAHPRRMGIYGVGMGAHAAALAAADRSELKVLVLDGLYPDVGYALTRSVYRDWEFGHRRLGFVPVAIFAVLQGTSAYKQRASTALAGMVGRDILFLVPESDTALAEEMKRIYATIPDQADADGNIAFLSTTHAEGLYGVELDTYHERVGEFFGSRLRVR